MVFDPGKAEKGFGQVTLNWMNFMRLVFVALIAAIILSGHVYGYTDPPPTMYIAAIPGTEVGTSVTIHADAMDSGFYFGIESVTIKEGNSVLEKKLCNGLSRCILDRNVQHQDAGTHTYTATADDRSGNKRSASITVKFRGATPPPVLLFEKNPYAEENLPLNLRIAAEGFSPTAIANITAARLPKSAKFDGSTFSWTPDFGQAGSYTITFTATDNKGQKTADTMTINVRNVNRPPVSAAFPGYGNINMNENSNMRFYINLTDPDKDNPSVTWLLDGRSVAFSASAQNTYTYRADFKSAGNHEVVAKIKDGDYTKRYVWNVTVNDVNRPPVMASMPDKIVDIGTKITATVRASDPDSDHLSYEAVQLPAGASFDPDTHVFTWTPQAPGEYIASFSVRDPYGYRASASLDVTVRPPKETTDFQRYEQAWTKMLQSQQQQKQQQPAAVQARAPQQQQNKTSRLICNPGYLCYSISYI